MHLAEIHRATTPRHKVLIALSTVHGVVSGVNGWTTASHYSGGNYDIASGSIVHIGGYIVSAFLILVALLYWLGNRYLYLSAVFLNVGVAVTWITMTELRGSLNLAADAIAAVILWGWTFLWFTSAIAMVFYLCIAFTPAEIEKREAKLFVDDA